MMTVHVDSAQKNVKEKYEMVPPEGGWGYAVMVGVSLIFVSINKVKIMLHTNGLA